MASNATISRYRPALCVLAALAAGCTIYYVHSTQQASATSRERPQPLRRRQANNRRRARPAELEELIALNEDLTNITDYPETVWDSKRLLQEWEASPRQFDEVYLLQQRYWSDNATPKTVPLRRRPPSLDVLTTDYGVPPEDAKTVRQDYEEAVLKTFICQKVPPRCTLVDEGGLEMFAEAFAMAPEDLMYPNLIKTIIHLFNTGAYDSWGLRKDTYKRYNVKPPETRRTDELDPQEWSIPRAGENSDDDYGSESSQPRSPPEEMEIVSQSVSSWNEDENDGSKREGQTLLNMLFHIAEDQARREGYVHRGVTCNSCNSGPIHGLRYRCINCFDFDLCETCEAMQQHPKTHLFLKIRIPTPSYAGSRRPQPLWYPGRTTGLSNSLNRDCNKLLSEGSGFTENETEALWDQFKNLAATEWPADPLGFQWAIDQETFHKCFALSASPAPRGRPASLVYDRMFCFYDSNKDGLIGFEEFVMGMAASKSKDPKKKLKRTFQGFDFDGDEFISRRDVLAIFKACYALQKDLARDLFMEFEADLLEGGNLRENIVGNQPISSAFTGSYDGSGHVRPIGQGKIRNANGDLIIKDDQGVLSLDATDQGDFDTIIGDLKEIAIYGYKSDDASADAGNPPASSADVDAFISTHNQWELDAMILPANWPPAHLVERDVETALGSQLSLNEIVSEVDRRSVLEEARERIKREQQKPLRGLIRDEAIKDRLAHSHFHLDGETELLDQQIGQSTEELPATSPSLRSSRPKEHNNPFTIPANDTDILAENRFRIPPPMPANIGQEILFQVTRECINELIDPLFKYREDLSLVYRTQAPFMKLCKEHLEIYTSPAVYALAWFQLKRFLKSFDEDASFVTREYSAPLVNFLDSLDQSDSPNYKKNQADEQMITKRLKIGMGVPMTLDHARVIQDQEDSDKMKANRATPTKEDHQSTPSLGSDASQQTESEVEYPAAAIDLHESVRVFNENDTSLEQEISKQNINDLLEESGYSLNSDAPATQTGPIITSTIPESQSSQPDPTLPQNRPNSSSEEAPESEAKLLPIFFNPSGDERIPSPTEPWSKDFKRFLRFLSVLQKAQQEDEHRGGPGRIDFEEYSTIVNGATGPDLEFLGQWIDMQAM